MAKAAPAPTINALSGMDAKMAALAKLEALSEEMEHQVQRRKSDRFVRRAVQAWRKGNIEMVGRAAMRAVEIDDTNPKAFHLLAIYLDRMGHQHKALVTYEKAFALNPNDPDLLINLGLMAWNLKMFEASARMFRQFIATCPDSPLGYNNLCSVMGDMNQSEEAIDILRGAIFRMPHEAVLWNALATILAEDGRVEESLVFYQESARLDPEFARIHHNFGYAYQHLGRLSDALEAYDRALTHAVDPAEIREANHSRSICLIGMGRLEEGFKAHEMRRDQKFRAYVHHVIEAPYWNGEDVTGKRVLIVGEQGLGDEIMFANILPDVQRAVGPTGKLQVAVDPRLIALFQRSFPEAEIGTYDDRTLIDKDGNKALRFLPFATKDGEPDYYAWMASPLGFLRKRAEDFPHQAFLTPDPNRVAEYKAKLAVGGPGLTIGICWRSMVMDAKRAKYYSALDLWEPLFKLPGVRFVNLQYGDCKEEIACAEEKFGVKIEAIEDLDLKNDLDGAAALSAAVDLVISAPTSAAAIAGSVGTETWFVTAGRTWPQLGTDEFPWYRKSRVFMPEKFGDWLTLMPKIAEAVKTYQKG